MKILSWNINGLRAALLKNALDWVWRQNPDVLCLQEIKVHPDQLKEEQRQFSGYEVIWNPAQKLGYSGVATFLRAPAVEVQLGMDMLRFDLEGRVISTLHPGFRLFNVYFPNGQRGKERLEYKLDFYAHLLSLCDRLHAQGENVVITGDFNTAHQPIDLRNPKSNAKTSGFLPEERAWVQRFLDHGFADRVCTFKGAGGFRGCFGRSFSSFFSRSFGSGCFRCGFSCRCFGRCGGAGCEQHACHHQQRKQSK